MSVHHSICGSHHDTIFFPLWDAATAGVEVERLRTALVRLEVAKRGVEGCLYFSLYEACTGESFAGVRRDARL